MVRKQVEGQDRGAEVNLIPDSASDRELRSISRFSSFAVSLGVVNCRDEN